jgi:Tat protein secretion system quality control protein TatD with DNase activity
VSGTSLRNKKTLDALKAIPIDRLLVASAAPYETITQKFASFAFVKTHFPKLYPNQLEKVNTYDP